MKPQVTLRRIQGDAEALLLSSWFGPGSVAAGLTNDLRENVRSSDLLSMNEQGRLLVFADENDQPFGLGTFASKGNPRNYEVAVLVGEESLWETGRGALAASRLIDHLFMTLDANKIFALTLVVNPLAISTLSSGGFTLEGRLRDHYYVDGNFEDCLIWGQTRAEYDQLTVEVHPESAFTYVPMISGELRERSERLLEKLTSEGVLAR
jgi:RimJ/RimL family protein N-acetyltransferase